jgi:6-phosphogluconolactonase
MAKGLSMNLIEYPDRELMMMQVADTLVGQLKTHLDHNDIVTLAVPGGTTPGPVFDTLSAMHLDWARVRILLTDERWVPEDDPRSNTALIRQRLLVDRAAAAEFIPFYQDDMSAEDGCKVASDLVAPLLPISVLVLGMGADMHTASLFPGAPGTRAALVEDAPPLLPVAPPDQDIQRVTLTAPVLRSALETHVMITGDEKRDALRHAQGLLPEEAPIATVLSGGMFHWAP